LPIGRDPKAKHVSVLFGGNEIPALAAKSFRQILGMRCGDDRMVGIAAQIPRGEYLASIDGLSATWGHKNRQFRAFAALDFLKCRDQQPMVRRRSETEVEILKLVDQARLRLLPRQQFSEQCLR